MPRNSNLKEWAKLPLVDVATLQRGFDLPERDRIPGKFPVISSSGPSGAHIDARVSGPGVVTGRYGSVGNVFYVEHDFWPLNTTLWVKDFHGNDTRYVYYLISTMDFRRFSVKTGVPGVNRNDLHTIPVLRPPLPEQKRIVEILRAWDEAIEETEKLIAAREAKFRSLRQLFVLGSLSG